MKFPEAFTTQMHQILAGEYNSFMDSMGSIAPVSVRLHPVKKSVIQGNAIPWCSTGRYLDERPVYTLDPFFHGGSYYVQEASSMFLEYIVTQLGIGGRPLRILDAAAAPGGKSTHLLSLVHPESLLVANEVINSRVHALMENIIKWGYPNAMITGNDPADFKSLPGFFDVIVLDAPCSGEGMFRKDPLAVNHWSPENIVLCSRRQKRILSDLWPALKEGGFFIYSTCTFNTSENEDNILWLITEKKAQQVSFNIPADWGIVSSGDVPGYRFYPHRLKGEGFFIAIVQKKTNEPAVQSKAYVQEIAQQHKKLIKDYVQAPFELFFFGQNGKISFVPAALREDMARISRSVRVIHAGTSVAEIKHSKVIPEHDLAMSVYYNTKAFPTLALTKEEALAYLRKETISKTATSKGFHLATYEGLPLGWLNVLPGRINNLYPSTWRIRNL